MPIGSTRPVPVPATAAQWYELGQKLRISKRMFLLEAFVSSDWRTLAREKYAYQRLVVLFKFF